MDKRTIILGIACFYHDSSAALIIDGNVVAAAQEERFSRIKNDSSFPHEAVEFCLRQANITSADISFITFYEKPLVQFERLLSTYIDSWPWGMVSFVKAMRSWSGGKFWIEQTIRRALSFEGPVLWVEHHYAHAASAYYTSPYDSAAIVVADGVGEWDTTTVGYARGNKIELTQTVTFPHSIGLLYSAVTYYLGFAVNSDEYKVMGLAPYGNPAVYEQQFAELVQWKEDGSFVLNRDYFAYEYGMRMISKKFEVLFGGAPRVQGSELLQRHKDIAAALQFVTERIVLAIATHASHVHAESYLCFSGGVALNAVANGKLAASKLFTEVYVPSAAGDAGASVGAALYVYYDMLGNPKSAPACTTSYLGPEYTHAEIKKSIVNAHASNQKFYMLELPDEKLFEQVAGYLEGECAIGWFSGRAEFGPRALGNRSILADPRHKENWQRINLKIKFRESFRPLAPSVLVEHAKDYFQLSQESPYMNFVARVKTDTVPAVTHVDGSARLHTVRKEDNPRYYALISAFYRRTGCPILVNTSFNTQGEPMVLSPEDALRCFFSTEMDYLVLGNFLLAKNDTLALPL